MRAAMGVVRQAMVVPMNICARTGAGGVGAPPAARITASPSGSMRAVAREAAITREVRVGTTSG